VCGICEDDGESKWIAKQLYTNMAILYLALVESIRALLLRQEPAPEWCLQ
jgi:hypothetical protein